jgi:hypothetical protein
VVMNDHNNLTMRASDMEMTSPPPTRAGAVVLRPSRTGRLRSRFPRRRPAPVPAPASVPIPGPAPMLAGLEVGQSQSLPDLAGCWDIVRWRPNADAELVTYTTVGGTKTVSRHQLPTSLHRDIYLRPGNHTAAGGQVLS